MTLGEELDGLLNSATQIQKDRFKQILEETQGNELLPHANPEDDRFWSLILWRKELREYGYSN